LRRPSAAVPSSFLPAAARQRHAVAARRLFRRLIGAFCCRISSRLLIRAGRYVYTLAWILLRRGVFVQSGRGPGVRVCLAWLVGLELGVHLFIICPEGETWVGLDSMGRARKTRYHLRVNYSQTVPERIIHQRCVVWSGIILEAVHLYCLGLCWSPSWG
jgi:hypothetical protein